VKREDIEERGKGQCLHYVSEGEKEKEIVRPGRTKHSGKDSGTSEGTMPESQAGEFVNASGRRRLESPATTQKKLS
jgi:hypothetical protein